MRTTADRYIGVGLFSKAFISLCFALLALCYGCKKDNPVASQSPTVTITSFLPQCAIAGQEIVLYGIGFDANKANDLVYFAMDTMPTQKVAAQVDSVVITDSLSRLYVTVPIGAISGTITVNINGDTATTKIPFRYIRNFSPVFQSYQPHSGTIGTVVTITGTGFDTNIRSTDIKVNMVPAKIISVTAKQLQFIVPSGASTGVITVQMDCDSIVLQGTFTIIPDSIVTFSPQRGAMGCLDTIITNTRLDTTGLLVKVGTVQAPIRIVSDSMIVITIPKTAVTAPISVTWGGQTAISRTNFIVLPDSILSFDPQESSVGYPVAIVTNVNFYDTSGIIIRFGNIPTSVRAVYDSEVIANVPKYATSAPISITWGGQTFSSTTNYTVIPDSITSFTPQKAVVGFPVTIYTNVYFYDTTGLIIKFGNAIAKSHSMNSTIISTNVPQGAITGPISIVWGAHEFASRTNFTVISNPAVQSFVPTKGPIGSLVYITANFSLPPNSGLTVKFGSVQAPVMQTNDSLIVVAVPIGAVSAPINITWNGQTFFSATNFTIYPDSLLSFSPHIAPHNSPVTIITNMRIYDTTGLYVKIGDIAATISSVYDSMIVASVPMNAVTAPISVAWGGVTIVSDSNLVIPAFSGCSVVFGNIPTYFLHAIHYQQERNFYNDTTLDFMEWGFVFPDSSCVGDIPISTTVKNDTVAFSYYSREQGYIKVVLDTMNHMMSSVSASQSFFMCYAEQGGVSISCKNIPYLMQPNGTMVCDLRGNAIQNAGTTFSFSSHDSYTGYGIGSQEYYLNNILPYTDSSYIRITLSP